MHELSIAAAMIEQLSEACQAAGATRIVRVDVMVGDLSGVDLEALELAFPMACEGTEAQGALLVAQREPLELLCSECKQVTLPEDVAILCGHCSSTDVEVVRGKTLAIKSMEVL